MSTIKDVAERAGVSVATVSRVLNKKGPISEKAIREVNKAVKELDYHPNIIARSLVSGKSRTIGVIMPALNNPFWSEIAQELDNCAKEINYHIFFSITPEKTEDRLRAIDDLQNRQVCGILYSGRWEEGIQEKRTVPIVEMMGSHKELPAVISDDETGGLLVARHLIAKGCKRLVHVSGDLNHYTTGDERTYSFMKECERRGISCKLYQSKSWMGSSSEIEGMTDLVNKIYYENPDMDGVFLSNDILATMCVNYAMSQGMRIPDDIRIVGYDDISLGRLIYPPLTTIRQDYRQLCKKAITLLKDQIEGKEIEKLTKIPVKLIERKTT